MLQGRYNNGCSGGDEDTEVQRDPPAEVQWSQKRELLCLLIRTLILSFGSGLMTSSKLNHLQKVLFPNTNIMGIRVSICEFEDVNIQSLAMSFYYLMF